MYRLLIADDELIERSVLYKTLSRGLGDQCEVWQAENGREALELFDEKKIEIAILDIEMPGINGIEAAQEMRRRRPDCCIIFLTAYDDFSYAKKAITIRALDYLLKPYQEEELISVVEQAMMLTDQNNKTEAEAHPVELLEYKDEQEDLGQARISKVAERIEAYIKSNYMNNLSLQDVAQMMNYSDAYFCKLFKQCFQKNFTAYLTQFRIEEAKKLLEQPSVNVKEIGEQVGYPDSNYFAKVFKRTTGSSPTEYRSCLFQQK